jgi:uncharacterized protein YbcI
MNDNIVDVNKEILKMIELIPKEDAEHINNLLSDPILQIHVDASMLEKISVCVSKFSVQLPWELKNSGEDIEVEYRGFRLSMWARDTTYSISVLLGEDLLFSLSDVNMSRLEQTVISTLNRICPVSNNMVN